MNIFQIFCFLHLDEHENNRITERMLEMIYKSPVSTQMNLPVPLGNEKIKRESKGNNILPPVSTTAILKMPTLQSTHKQKLRITVPSNSTSNRPRRKNLGLIRSRFDLEIQQATARSYERYASASIQQTTLNCLREAAFFKRKSWLQQVEISKEMVKQRTKRRICPAINAKNNCLLSSV